MYLPAHDQLTDALTKVSTNPCFEGRIMIYRYENHLILPPIILDLPILAYAVMVRQFTVSAVHIMTLLENSLSDVYKYLIICIRNQSMQY